MEKVYDKYGQYIGYKDKDIYGNEAFYDREGHKQGTYGKDLMGNEAYYDAAGRKQGTFHKDYYGDKAYYDASGRMQGSYHKDYYGNVAFFDRENRRVGTSMEAGLNQVQPPPSSALDPAGVDLYAAPAASGSSAEPAPSRPYKLNYSHSAVDSKNSLSSANLNLEQLNAYATAAAQALKNAGVPFDVHTTKRVKEEKIERGGLFNLKKTVSYIEKDVPDEGAWMLQRYDEEDEKDGYEREDVILYVLTESGRLLHQRTRDNVPTAPGKRYYKEVKPWEPSASFSWAKYLDLYLQKRKVPLSSNDFTGQSNRSAQTAIPQKQRPSSAGASNVGTATTAGKQDAASNPARSAAQNIMPEGNDVPSQVLDFYERMADKATFKAIRKQADAGDKIAMEALGLCFLTGRTIWRDKQAGIAQIRNAANRNEPFAQYLLGLICEKNWFGLGGDKLRMYKWYSSASELGDAIAMRRFAELIENGVLNGGTEKVRKLRAKAVREALERTKSRNAIEQILFQASQDNP